jgi:hypothetical protein
MSGCKYGRRHWFSVYGAPGLRTPVCVRCEAPNPRPLSDDEWVALTDFRTMGGSVGLFTKIALDRRAAVPAETNREAATDA